MLQWDIIWPRVKLGKDNLQDKSVKIYYEGDCDDSGFKAKGQKAPGLSLLQSFILDFDDAFPDFYAFGVPRENIFGLKALFGLNWRQFKCKMIEKV